MRKEVLLFFCLFFAGCSQSAGSYFYEGLEYAKNDDLANAEKSYDISCSMGEMAACNNLGVINVKKGKLLVALGFYQKACNNMYPLGCSNQAELFVEHGLGTLEAAKNAANYACKQGYKTACDNALPYIRQKEAGGTRAIKNHNIKDQKRFSTRDSAIQACNNHNYTACAVLADNYLGEKNFFLAEKYGRLACDHAVYEGCMVLALVELFKGNSKETTRLVNLACQHGVQFACNFLKNSMPKKPEIDRNQYNKALQGALNFRSANK